MLKIGLDAQILVKPNSGVSYYVFHLLDELVRQKQDVLFILYATTDEGEIAHFKQYANVRIKKSGASPAYRSIWRQLVLPFFLWKDKIDVYWGTTQCLPLIKPRRTKTLLTLYDFVYLLFPKTMPFRYMVYQKSLMGSSLRAADYILPISRGTGERLKEHYGLNYAAIIPPPRKPDIFYKNQSQVEPFLKANGLSFGRYVVSVGTWEPRKNYSKLIAMYVRILQKQGSDAVMPLVIIGGKGWKSRNIETCFTSAEKMYPTHIKIMRYIQDHELSLFLSGARCYLSLSLYEGYGMPIAEARYCRTPVVCLDLPEMREAAEGEGKFLQLQSAEGELENLLISPSEAPREKTPFSLHYPTNRESASKMARIIDEIQAKTCRVH